MRRVAGYALVGLGVFMLTLAPMLRFYVYPRLAVAALDQFSSTVSAAKAATIFSTARRAEVRTDLVATRRIRGDVNGSSRGVATWDVFQRVDDADGALVSATTDRVAFDRRTSLAVHCCGENVNGVEVEHEGISYKFPFGTEKKTYPYFDLNLRRSMPMVFQETAEVDGLPVYRFRQRIEPTKIAELEVPGSVIGAREPSVTIGRFYSTTRTVWVEPRTGLIVKGQEEQLSTGRDRTGADVLTLTDATLTSTDATVKQQVEVAADGRRRLGLLAIFGPLVLFGLGAVLTALGMVMTSGPPETTARRAATRREPAPVY
jgi:hypothetical protein